MDELIEKIYSRLLEINEIEEASTMAGGAVAGGLLGLIGKAGARGAAIETAIKGIYTSASAKAGSPLMKKAVEQGLKSIGSQPSDNAIKLVVNAVKGSANEDIEIELTPDQFKEAMDLLEAEGKPVLQNDTELAKLADETNQAFGIDDIIPKLDA